ncbi:uroporphyrinogen-III synthase [Mannheimia sp. AT1]|uniref:Uroporphyrinogen-III synthase n=1 Tax=Mannheimia cairinae TaxID=3025936 RepID=A0ABT5MND0_9PAST|nr:uroporphyrinogen-III synthase [Mannheimia cairinae]MDD0823679.1 uroporphyrinogen-III synthase [Mannheimia cairinae]MDD0825389.1 uroporphyrinogen-III synthase [Mannheimia cairinae]
MNVLVTRPDSRGQELVDMLNEKQIFAIHQPLFIIEAGQELPLLPTVLSSLNSGDYVFAVSTNAVDYAVKTLSDTGFHFRTDLKYFAVGQRTAKYFSEKAQQAVIYPIDSENSEGVLELPEMQMLQDKTILILRANSGRELLAEKAIQRGASIQYLECYRREPVKEDIPEKLSLCKRLGVDTIIVTSSEILALLYEQTKADNRQWLLDCHLVVVSQRIAKIAKQMGWQSDKIILSDKADNVSLMNTLLFKFDKSN